MLFKGTCKDNNKQINIISNNKVNKDSNKNTTCKEYYRKRPIQYSKWHSQFPICAERRQIDYLNLNIFEKECPELYPKKCGKIDSLGNILCIKNELNCPINDIIITSDNSNPPVGYITVDIPQQSNTSTTKIYYTNTKTDNNIILYTKISDKQPCADPSYRNYFNNSVGIIDSFYEKSNCSLVNNKYHDTDYKEIGSWNFEDLLQYNDIYNSTIIFYNAMNINLNHSVSLYGKNYVGIKQSCKEKILNSYKDTNKYFDNLKKTISYVNLSETLRYINYICAIIFFIFITGFVVYNVIMKTFFWDRSYEGCFNFFTPFFSVVIAILMIISLILGNLLSKSYSDYSILQDCLDDTNNILVNSFIESCNSSYKWFVISEVCMFVVIICIIIDLVIWCVFKGKSINERNIALLSQTATATVGSDL